MLEQLDKHTREDLYRFLAELLWQELHEPGADKAQPKSEAPAPVARDVDSAA